MTDKLLIRETPRLFGVAIGRFVWEMGELSTRGADACWPWSRVGAAGYGLICIDGEEYLAHRIAWAYYKGQLGPHDRVLHHCDNPPCVNLRHLFIGRQKDNVADAIAKGRWVFPPVGEAHHSAKLTEQDVRDIRARTEASHRGLAREYGVSHKLIMLIRERRIWRNVQ